MRTLISSLTRHTRRTFIGATTAILITAIAAPSASASDQMYFSAVDDVTKVLVQLINAETVRVEIASWYLSEHSISIAVANRWNAGVPVRIIGDRGAIFEGDPVHTKGEFYWLANQGIPIRLRVNPTWYPEIMHWKTAILVGQGKVLFGSGNFAPTELTPVNSTNYCDESEMVTDDPVLVGAFKTKFDQMWNDTAPEPSFCCSPPYLMNWDDACAVEHTGRCSDYATLYPNPKPMVISTARLEPDNPMPPEMVWGQGPLFNNRMSQEINKEPTRVDMIVYRLTVPDLTQALLSKWQSGVPVRIIVDTFQYANKLWPEYELTHAYIDQLYAAGVSMQQRVHDGVTHMKTLITSTYATNASSNYAAGWQRDQDYFISATAKPAMYQALKNRFQTMWTDNVGFTAFSPQPPDAANLASPASAASGVGTAPTLVWNRAAFATSYDVYLGTSLSNMSVVGNVAAVLSSSPPTTYSWTPSAPLGSGTTYFWKVVSRTFATPVNTAMAASSSTWSFSTAGTISPPLAPSDPSPANGATGVNTPATMTWSAPGATSYDVSFGTSNPPPTVSSGQANVSYTASSLSNGTTYFWRIVARNSAGTTTGSVWSFTTSATAPPPAENVVIYANDVPASALHGSWSFGNDATAAAGVKLVTPDNGLSNTSSALASPGDYVDVTFDANAGTPYTLWLRIQALNNNKYNDSVWVQFSDALSGGSPIYPLNSTSGLLVNLATDSAAGSLNAWGWQNAAYWLSQATTVTFANGGTHTMRIQMREDGVQFDQIVLSPSQYLSSAPGPVGGDSTIVPKPSVGTPPSAPGSPSPANGATGVGTSQSLTWSASGATSYDVSFGTSNPPPQVSTGQTSASYTPSALANSTTYFWQIGARNAVGTMTGPVWSFTTAAGAPPPGTPSSPSPANGAAGVTTSPSLTWTASNATSYDVSFGTSSPPPQVSTGQTSASYTPTALANSTMYFWQIVARNAVGTTTGPVWSFTTAAGAPPPGTPSSPSPANGAAGVTTSPSLTWTASNATSYDVSFGTSSPPPQVSTGQTSASFTPSALANSTMYFWQIVARNGVGTTTGPVWSFTTAAGAPPPGTPSSPSPASGAAGVTTSPSLTWTASNATSYDVSFGTSSPPPQVSTSQPAASYTPTALANSTTYFWQIAARNAVGTTTGPVWSFTTAAAPPPPPTNIVIYASDIPGGALHGSWATASDSSSPNAVKLVTPDLGVANINNPLVSPTDYIDVTFDAPAGTPYTLWLRIRATADSKWNDSVWVQFSDALAGGGGIYPLNTTQGLLVNLANSSCTSGCSLNAWGWQNGAYWLSQATTVTFSTSGTHTMRIQVREDGVQLDQIVLSPNTYLSSPPGPVGGDNTIVPKP